ncbi:MAG: biopolymer transporter ExbD [Selenomonadaceae bacterium]|nr:biopolymer transporter ExbD [Selenomonadaceae bacterium]
MIKFTKNRDENTGIMLSPMIDMIFLLLVFFILSTMYMSDLKAVPVQLPTARQTQRVKSSPFVVTVKAGGAVWLGDKLSTQEAVIAAAKEAKQRDKDFAVILRGDGTVNYGTVIALLDKFKEAGISRIGLAADSEGTK